MVYMISYDFGSPTNNREKVMEDIKSLGTWCKYLTTTFLVKTDGTKQEVTDICTRNLDNNDRMIIAPVSGKVSGWLTDEQWAWIRENLL